MFLVNQISLSISGSVFMISQAYFIILSPSYNSKAIPIIAIQIMLEARPRKPLFDKQSKNQQAVQVQKQGSASHLQIKQKQAERQNDLNAQRELDRLTSLTSDLKLLLKQSKSRNDELLASYSQLQLKHQIIEKEYLNLKYEIGKATLQGQLRVRKDISDKIAIYIRQILWPLKASGQHQCEVTTKVGKLMEDIARIPALIMDNRRAGQLYLNAIEKAVHPAKQIDQSYAKIDESFAKIDESFVKIDECSSDQQQQIRKQENISYQASEHIPDISTTMETDKESHQKVETVEENQVQPESQVQVQPANQLEQPNPVVIDVMTDEYYGDLEEYQHLQDRIKLRKNYELLKNHKTNADAKRKKIFGGD